MRMNDGGGGKLMEQMFFAFQDLFRKEVVDLATMTSQVVDRVSKNVALWR